MDLLPSGPRFLPEEEFKVGTMLMSHVIPTAHLAWESETLPDRVEVKSFSPFRKGPPLREDFIRLCDAKVFEIETDPMLTNEVLAGIIDEFGDPVTDY